jgi:hypothetical protein
MNISNNFKQFSSVTTGSWHVNSADKIVFSYLDFIDQTLTYSISSQQLVLHGLPISLEELEQLDEFGSFEAQAIKPLSEKLQIELKSTVRNNMMSRL